MRILVSTSTFPLREDDGSPRFVYDLCRALARHCAVSVLAPHAPGAATQEQLGGLDVHRFAYFAPRRRQRLAYGDGMPDNLKGSLEARLQVLPYVAAQVAATRRLARRLRADVVNTHWIVPQGLSAAIARGRDGAFRHAVTLHGGDAHLIRRLPFGRPLARLVADRSDALLAVSSNVRANLDAALGRPSGARLQPMGVHVARFREGPRAESPFPDGHLLFVGRLIAIKGVSVLLRALPAVRAAHPGVGLVVIGDGPFAPALRWLAADLGITEAVHFLGALPHAQVAAHLRGCRAAVVPSIRDEDGREEGMPAVVAEALAAGARVVASDSGGIPDVLRDGENGWLARPGDPEHLAVRILEALAAPPGSGIDRNAAAAAAQLDWEAVARAYLSVFEAMLRQRAGAS